MWDCGGRGIQLLRLQGNLIGSDKEKLCFGINESLYQPGAGDAIDFHLFACDPFHNKRIARAASQRNIAAMKKEAGILLVLSALTISAAELDTNLIQRVTSLTGKMNTEEGVFKVTSPRNDVKVSVDKWQMPPFMGLTSWAAFTAGKEQPTMVMGDLVLFQDEVNSVMSAALDNGLSVTALHNHFFFDDPKVYFMHIGGEGKTETLAQGVKAALDTVKKLRRENPTPAKAFLGDIPAQNSISAEPLQQILNQKGEAKDGMFKAVIGRKAKMPCGCEVGKEMGVNTWAAFAGTDANAVVDGDFAVLEDELQQVLKSLRKGGINIVAIHHHMTHENPRHIFLHYWGKGKATDLAAAVNEALTAQSKVQQSASIR